MFEPNRQKTGGRKKGVKNKKTILRAEEIMANQNFNPTTEMIRLLLDPSTPIDIKAKLAIELNALINPKAKATDTPEDPPEPDIPQGKPNLTVLSNDRLTELLKKPNGSDT